MILFFTDFGWLGPYVGQMHAAVARYANTIPTIDLMHDAPPHDPTASAYMLAALADYMAEWSVCVAVVDPGVGTDRDAIVLKAGNRFFVGPDNGLLSITARRCNEPEWFRISWRPDNMSASFHGRDLFAPVAAQLATRLSSGKPEGTALLNGLAEEIRGPSVTPPWADDIDEVIYIDGFGNCVLGRRAATLPPDSRIIVGDVSLARANTFGDDRGGRGFWYENSMGLVEIAVNKGRAADRFAMTIGESVRYA